MKEHWVKVYSSGQPYQINIVSALLAENNIPSHEINKQDSVYRTIGEIELYVEDKDEVLARFLIKQQNL